MHSESISLFSATITLFLVMDPLGNIPAFISILNSVHEKRRTHIILRESFIAFVILTVFLFAGQAILKGLNISYPALYISGGILLFLISLNMIFPTTNNDQRDKQVGEPFIVPLAIPLLAGPSAIATVQLFATQNPHKMSLWFSAVLIASCLTTLALLFANKLRCVFGIKGLIALERLMGMLLITIAVQMFLNGIKSYIAGFIL